VHKRLAPPIFPNKRMILLKASLLKLTIATDFLLFPVSPIAIYSCPITGFTDCNKSRKSALMPGTIPNKLLPVNDCQ